MICKKINEYLEESYRTSNEVLCMVGFGLFWIHLMIGIMNSGMDVYDYLPIYLEGMFFFIFKVVIGVLIIDGGFYMFKGLIKWLMKNEQWFDDTDEKLKELERRLDDQRDYVYSLRGDLEKLDKHFFSLRKEQGKVKKFIDFVNEEKIEKPAAEVEKSVGVDEF